MTNGHLDVIRRAAELYEEVVVAVVRRSVRKNETLFGIEERVGFIERATADLPGVRVEPFSNLVVEFARSVGAKAIVKGLRAISDFEYELELHQLNRRQDPEIESVYLMSISAVQFPLIEWRQGARHVRGQDRRSGARRRWRGAVAGRAAALTNLEMRRDVDPSSTTAGPAPPRR